jgi:hypothetical protein
MADFLEHDFDNPAHRQHRRPRVEEYLPPEQPDYHHHDARGLQRWIIIAAVAVLVVILFRSPTALLMLAALTGWPTIAASLILVAILSVIAWRERRVGRPF